MSGLRWRTGVTVGTFNPPHMGHAHLLRTGASKVDHLHVLLAHRSRQTIPGEDRAAWLRDAAPANVTVHLTPDDLPDAPEPWADRTLEVVPAQPDVAFTSEPWGPTWASRMYAAHMAVDLDRRTADVTASSLRRDLRAGFHHLVPAARAALAVRVAVVGATGSGKTTLARSLARTLRTVWAPDHTNHYLEGRRHLIDQTITSDELRRIAIAQHRMIDDLARKASSGIVIADGHALCAAVWHCAQVGTDDAVIDRLVAINTPDHYLVCAPDHTDPDDGRGASEDRHAAHAETLRRIRGAGADHTVVEGPHLDRMVQALRVIDGLTARPVLI